MTVDPDDLTDRETEIYEAGYTAGQADTRRNLRWLAEAYEKASADGRVLAAVGRMYLDALDADPENEILTLVEALRVTDVRDAVERAEAEAGVRAPHAGPAPDPKGTQ